MKVTAVLLAAGQGTRMKSKLLKVLQPVCGKPMLAHVLAAAGSASTGKPVVVIGRDGQSLRAFLGETAECVLQDPPLGTAHALRQAEASLRDKTDLVLVTYADMPLLRPETLRRLVETQEKNPGPITLLTVIASDPRGFGRVIRDPQGNVQAIVEEAAATPEQSSIRELNVGAYCFSAGWLWPALQRIPLSAKGEYYLTDTVELAAKDGLPVQALVCDDLTEVIGINTRVHLAEAEAAMRARINSAHMLAGVTIVNPGVTYIDQDVSIGADTVIWPNTYLRGKTVIGSGCSIGPNTIAEDTSIGDGCEILATVMEEAVVEDNVSIGPFARLRKGAHLCTGVHLGNFGEVKESTLGPGTKMGHFSYIGNASIGADVNIGAGTITCNYDGVRKNPTEIGEGAFIGSDTMLVAPVKVGAHAKTGAGAVVTKDVEADTLVVGVPARPIRKLNQGQKMSNLSDEERRLLIELAGEARRRAYAPYSNYPVGAALRTKSGRVFTGCNVENAAYPAGMCAERVAVFKAVSEGEREFEVMAVSTSNGGSPCGGCRQVLAEFGLDTLVLIADGHGRLVRETTVAGLLPEAFTPRDLQEIPKR